MESKSLLDILVIDAGAHTIRAGRAEDFPTDDESPHIVLPSCVVEPSPSPEQPAVAVKRRQVYDADGCISDWDALECNFEYLFYEQLGWPEGDEGYVLCTENVQCMARSSRERLTQTLFETFNVKGCYMLDSSIACLYAAGKVSGMTIDVGHTGTNVVQVIDGAAVVGTGDRHAIGGAVLDDLLEDYMSNQGVSCSQQDLQTVKEKFAAVADSREDFLEILDDKKEVEMLEHALPDGQVVKIGKERYTLGESLVHPTSISTASTGWLGHAALGVSQAALSCLTILSDTQQQQQQRQMMMDNMLLCGGGSMIPHFGSRFMTELRSFLPVNTSIIKLTVPDYLPKRSARFAAYTGAAIVAKTMTANHTMTKEEYEERGPQLMLKKC